jgi:hypothetical protein
VIVEQPAIDTRDTRLALNVALDLIERMLITDKKRWGLPDFKQMMTDLDLARSVLEEESID